MDEDFVVPGRPASEYARNGASVASPDYFRVLRVPLLRGRWLELTDRSDSPPVLVINEQLSRKHFAGEDPVGQRVTFDRVPDSTSTWYTIVGVVGSERQSALSVEPKIEASRLTPSSRERWRS